MWTEQGCAKEKVLMETAKGKNIRSGTDTIRIAARRKMIRNEDVGRVHTFGKEEDRGLYSVHALNRKGCKRKV